MSTTATWVGGPQDGATVIIGDDVTWVAVLEDRRRNTPAPAPGTADPSLVRYSVPVIDGKIIWAQRVLAP